MRLIAAILLLLSLPALAVDDGWRETAIDAHEARIDEAHARASTSLDQLADDAYGRDELTKVRALLAAPSVDRPNSAVMGKWRCSSTQVGSLGIFSYPNFRCEIRTLDDGTVEFSKLSGSQRRSGQLFPYSAHSWVLLGVSYVNDDPYKTYSANLSDPTEADKDADTVGLLETLKDGRMRILLDAEGENFEVYTLTR